jgi:thiol:disulfide interchange protein
MQNNTTLRTLLGGVMLALGLWFLSGYAPQLGTPHNTKLAGWLAIAAGVWLVPFLKRN